MKAAFEYGKNGTFSHGASFCSEAFEKAGLTMPKIIFWNLRASGSVSFAAESTTPGVGMLSGFSQAVFKTFMTGADFTGLTPASLMEEALKDERYDAAADAVNGIMRKYY